MTPRRFHEYRLLLALLAAACCGDDTGDATATASDATSSTTTAGPQPSSTSDASSMTDATTTAVPTTSSSGPTASDSTSSSGTSTSDAVTTDDTQGETSDASSTDASSTDASSTDASSTDASSTDATTTGGMSVCGDGLVDGDEACDDGDQEDGDGCEADCSWTPCAVLWEVLLDESMNTNGKRVATDSEDNIAVVGTIDQGLTTARLKTWKFSPDGELLWSYQTSDERSQGNGVAIRPDDAITVTGFESLPLFSRDISARYEPDGLETWVRQNIQGGSSRGEDIAMTPTGAPIVTGIVSSTPWIAELDAATGDTSWSVSGLPDGFTQAIYRAIATDADGSLYVAGTGHEMQQGGAMIVEKRTPAGELVWSSFVYNPDGPPTSVSAQDLEVAPWGAVVVAGSYNYALNMEPNSGYDMWMGSFSGDDGELQWADVYTSEPGMNTERANGVAASEQGFVFFVGYASLGPSVGLFRKYTQDGEFVCDATIAPVPEEGALMRGVTVNSEGAPIITGDGDNRSLYLAKLTP